MGSGQAREDDTGPSGLHLVGAPRLGREVDVRRVLFIRIPMGIGIGKGAPTLPAVVKIAE